MRNRLTIATLVFALGSSGLALAKDDKPPATPETKKNGKIKLTMKPGDPPADAAKPAPAAMPAPKPAPELDMFKAWVGTWKCDGTMSTQDMTEMKTTGTHKIAAVAGGMWYEGVHTVAKNGKFPGVMGHGTLSYDAAGKKYVLFSVDSWGGWMMVTSSDGMSWAGDMVMMGQKMPFKYLWTKGEGKKPSVTMVGEIAGKQAWSETCTK